MKKLMLVLGLVFLTYFGFGQATPGGHFRVATATTDMGQNLPIGTTVYCVATDAFYLTILGVVSTDDITSAPTKFSLIPKTSDVTIQGWINDTADVLRGEWVDDIHDTADILRGEFSGLVNTYIVEQFDEATTGATGTQQTLTGTPIATTVMLELNGLMLKTAEYTLSTNHFTVVIPVYQYDRYKISYQY